MHKRPCPVYDPSRAHFPFPLPFRKLFGTPLFLNHSNEIHFLNFQTRAGERRKQTSRCVRFFLLKYTSRTIVMDNQIHYMQTACFSLLLQWIFDLAIYFHIWQMHRQMHKLRRIFTFAFSLIALARKEGDIRNWLFLASPTVQILKSKIVTFFYLIRLLLIIKFTKMLATAFLMLQALKFIFKRNWKGMHPARGK